MMNKDIAVSIFFVFFLTVCYLCWILVILLMNCTWSTWLAHCLWLAALSRCRASQHTSCGRSLWICQIWTWRIRQIYHGTSKLIRRKEVQTAYIRLIIWSEGEANFCQVGAQFDQIRALSMQIFSTNREGTILCSIWSNASHVDFQPKPSRDILDKGGGDFLTHSSKVFINF